MTFLFLNSDTMGQGDDELGRKLLISFLKNLVKSEAQIDMVGCANGGVKLTTREGEGLGYLRQLAERGTRIATCGTCLDHLGIRDQLLIGEIGTMEQSIRTMIAADKVISP